MKAYKGFDKNLVCRDFQYEISEEYECETAEICKSGFHACIDPNDVFAYYPPNTSRFCEVEIDGDVKTHHEDSKVCGTCIRVIREFTPVEFMQECMDFQSDKKTQASGDCGHAQASGSRRHAQASGYQGHAQASGYKGHAQTSGLGGHAQTSGSYGHAQASGTEGHAQASGYKGHAQASGYKGHAQASDRYGHAQASGSYGHAQASGYQGHAQASGYKGHAQTSGSYGHAQASGTEGHAQASGYKGHAQASGKNSTAIAVGPDSTAIASSDCEFIVLTEYNNFDDLLDVKVGRVGIEIEKDKCYRLKNGKFVEVIK